MVHHREDPLEPLHRHGPVVNAEKLLVAMLTIIAVVAVGAAALRADVRQWVAFQFEDTVGEPTETFAAPPIDPDRPPLTRIAVAGDVGTGEDAAYATGAAMDVREGSVEYDALLLLGDNVYPNGDPDQLDRTVYQPFADVLDDSTQVLAVLGNHDVRDDNADAHAAALGMPARWYATTIDDVLVLSLDSNQPDNPDQLAWLETTLANNDATWIIATMHHPPYSGGYHGSSDNVRNAFSPLLEAHRVDLVLAGHEHDYQRFQPVNGTTYIVSGAGAKLRPAARAEFTEVAWSTHHFLDINIYPDEMTVTAINHDGEAFDAITLTTSPDS